MNKWYMHNPASYLENDTHKLLWDFNIRKHHIISKRRPDLIIINRIKPKGCEMMDKNHDLARDLKKRTMEYEVGNCTNRDWCIWYSN